MSDALGFKVESAGILKRALKEIDALGGDYVSVLLTGAEIGGNKFDHQERLE